MNKTIMFAAAAMVAMPATTVFAADMKAVSTSVVTIGALPEGGYVSASVVAYGEPPAPKAEEKRRFEVGFVPSVPPAPNAEIAVEEKAAMTVETGTEPAKAGMGEGEGQTEVSTEKTASVTSVTSENDGAERIDVEGMKLRTE